MLRPIVLTAVLAVSWAPLWAQEGTWRLLTSSPDGAANGRHEDISFPTPDVGYLVNYDGDLYRTKDGGDTWSLLHAVEHAGSPVRLRSVGFANPEKGWIGGLTSGYVLWQTDDGGATLNNLTPRLRTGNDLGICGLWVVNENVVYGVGRYYGPARLYMTKDGGRTWSVKNMDQYAGRLIDVFFFDENNGFAVGGTDAMASQSRAVVLRTEDGGATWQVKYVSSQMREWGWKISFPSTSVGYVSVEQFPVGVARVLKTIDGGDTWGESQVSLSRPLQGIGFSTPLTGWASGRGTTLATEDGGITWQKDELDLDPVVNRFRMFGDTLGYAVGSRVYKFTTKTQVHSETEELPLARSLLGQNYPNPFYPLTTFDYEIPETGYVEIAVYDLLGRTVKRLVSWKQPTGAHRATWDGTDEAGERQGPGVYLYSLRANRRVETRKMILLGVR